jgi:hypothetical protein
VLADGVLVGRIFKANASPVGASWMWTLAFGHDDRPWSGDKACGCGGAGMPCPSCNVSNPDNPPRLPAGFQRDESLDDE